MNNVTDLPSRLYTPPSSIVNPPASTSKQELPFNELAWEDFEKLCLRLASKDSDIEQCRLYGNRGEAQEGIDIFGRKSGSSKYAVFQCKRVKRFGPAKIREAVNLFLDGDWKDRSETFCLCTQVSLQSVANSKELIAQIERSSKENINLVAWDSHRLAILLKEHPDLVYDFFGMEWLKRFSGEPAAQAFSNRMCPQDVKLFRQKLGDFYKHVFNEQDTGILLSQIPGRRPLPIEDRFVVPDIVENRSVPDGDSHGEVASNDVRNGYGYEFSIRSQSPFDESGKQRRNQSARMIEERIPVEQWLCNSGNCVLLGEPGAGKSTLLRFLAIDLLRDTPYFQKASKRWGSHLPVWIPFALWTKLVSDTPATSSLTDVLRHWLQGFNELRMIPLVEAAIKDDRLLLLVDGLDEWDGIDSAEIALSRLKVFAEQRSTPVVATSRPLGFQQLPVPSGSWRIGKIAEFNLCQQSRLANMWVSHWHQNGGGSSEEGKIHHETTSFISELEQNADLKQLAGIPLLLLLLIYHRLQEASLPEDRFKAYESMIDHLIGTRPRKRRVAAGVVEVDNVLTADEFRRACANLAFTIQCSEGAGAISRVVAQDVLIKHAEDEELGLGMCRTEARRLGQQLLDLAEGNLGLVVRRSASDVGFFHRTFHEYLAACHLTRLPMSKQQELLAAHCINSQWTETILCLFHMTQRTDELESLVHAIEKAKRSASSLGRNNIEALLTEIAFGQFRCSPRLAKKLAVDTFAVIERGDWMPQRKRLVRRVIRGLKSTSLRPLIEQKVTQWIPGRLKWRANLYEAIAKWSPSNELDDCLWNGIHEESFFCQQAAVQSLCHVRNGDPEVGDRFAEFAIQHPRVSVRKVALQALLFHWPNHPRLGTAIDQADQSLDPDLKALAITSRIARQAQTDQDKATLLELGRGNCRFTDLSYLVVESLVKGWPSDREIKEACLSAVRQEFPHRSQLDRTVATQVLVLGFPNDPDIAEYFAECVENSDHPFVLFSLTTGFASVLQRLQQTSNEHRRLRHAVDTWLEKCTINGPDELQAARFTKSDRAKAKLLSLLDDSWRFWAAKGLIELWPEDEAVVTRLREMMLGENKAAATLAVQMRHVIRDRQLCHARLIELLRDKSVGRKDLVLHAILDLGLELIDFDIVDEVFDQILIVDTTQSRDIGAITTQLIERFPQHPRVRQLVIEKLNARQDDLSSPSVSVIAAAYYDDSDMQKHVLALLSPLPDELREVAVTCLSTSSFAKDFVFKLFSEYDVEYHGEIKTMSSITYHRLLKSSGLETKRAIDLLRESISCYGPDHEARRQAAFCGLLELDELSTLMTAKERIGSDGQCSIGLYDISAMRANVPLLKSILQHWNHIKKVLGDSFWNRLSKGTGREEAWSYFLSLLDAHADPCSEALEYIGALTPKTLDHTGLQFVARVRPRSSLLYRCCLETLRIGDNRYDASGVDSVSASELLGIHFPSSRELLDAVTLCSKNWIGNKHILALFDAWPQHELLRGAYEQLSLKSHRFSDHVVVRLKCQFDSADEIVRLIERFCGASTLPKESQCLFAQPLVRRISSDAQLTMILREKLVSTSSPSEKVTLTKLISSAVGVNADIRHWVEDELLKQQDRPEVGLDLFSERLASVEHTLLACTMNIEP